jgi:hypothetical protein
MCCIGGNARAPEDNGGPDRARTAHPPTHRAGGFAPVPRGAGAALCAWWMGQRRQTQAELAKMP